MTAKRSAERFNGNRKRYTAAAVVDRLENRTLFAFGITQLTTTLPTTAGTAGPAEVVASGNDVFFTATNAATGNTAVWSSTGTAASTAPIALPTGASGTAANLFAATGDSTTAGAGVFFNVGADAYHSDGTAAGTTAVTVPDTTAGAATPLTVVGTFNGNVILLANRGGSQELWEQNATSNGQVDLGGDSGGRVDGGRVAGGRWDVLLRAGRRAVEHRRDCGRCDRAVQHRRHELGGLHHRRFHAVLSIRDGGQSGTVE